MDFEPLFWWLSRQPVDISGDKCGTVIEIPFDNMHLKRGDDTKLDTDLKRLKNPRIKERAKSPLSGTY